MIFLQYNLNSGRNWLGVMFGALHCMAQRPSKCGAGGEWRR